MNEEQKEAHAAIITALKAAKAVGLQVVIGNEYTDYLHIVDSAWTGIIKNHEGGSEIHASFIGHDDDPVLWESNNDDIVLF